MLNSPMSMNAVKTAHRFRKNKVEYLLTLLMPLRRPLSDIRGGLEKICFLPVAKRKTLGHCNALWLLKLQSNVVHRLHAVL